MALSSRLFLFLGAFLLLFWVPTIRKFPCGAVTSSSFVSEEDSNDTRAHNTHNAAIPLSARYIYTRTKTSKTPSFPPSLSRASVGLSLERNTPREHDGDEARHNASTIDD